MKAQALKLVVGLVALVTAACSSAASAPPPWEADNPIVAVPEAPLGAEIDLASLSEPPTPDRVRLGRWLFYDKRLSADNTVACATCHRPEHAFSEPTAVSTGIGGQKGRRKAPSLRQSGRRASAALLLGWSRRIARGSGARPDRQSDRDGHGRHAATPWPTSCRRSRDTGRISETAFGSDEITGERIAKAIVAYEQTRMSGNSAWDRWRYERDEKAVSDQVKQGHELFFGKGEVPAVSRRKQLHRQQVSQPRRRLGSGREAIQR